MGYRIKELRTLVSMSQQELASKSGVARAIVSGLESGRITVTTTETLLKIAKALDTTVDKIFFEDAV